jgi:hypothetical protein
MVQQFTGGDTPLEFPQGFETALTVGRHIAVHGRLGNPGQPCCLRVHQSVADEPQDFHPLLHSRMGMFKAFPAQGLLICFRKSQAGHL